MSLINFFPTVSKRTNSFNVFEDFFRDEFPVFSNRITKSPSVNIAETDKGYNIELAAPGLQKEDFDVKADKLMLTISAKKKDMADKYSRREFSYHEFTKTFHLPDSVNVDNIEAKYENGILNVFLAKKEEAKSVTKQIKIK